MSDTPEQDRLAARFAEMQVTQFSVFPGTEPATAEDIAREVNRALDQMEAGAVKALDEPPRCVGPQVEVADWLAERGLQP